MGLTTFTTALSGIAANSMGLSVVGNNLANLNTVGFKTSNINFADVLGQTFSTAGTTKSGSLMSIGLGAQVSSVRQSMSQGPVQSTSNPLDVAIQGKGFLVVKNDTGRFYTRAGDMHLDSDGFLVSDNGLLVQGYVRDPLTGKIDPSLGLNSIKMPAGVDNPVPTSEFGLSMNLDASAADGDKFSTSFQIFDSLGTSHIATLTLQKKINTGPPPSTTWHFDVTIPNNEIAGVSATDTQKFSLLTGAVATANPTAGGLMFDTSGKLTSAFLGPDPSTPPAVANLTIPPTGVTMPSLADGAKFNSSMKWTLLGDGGVPTVSGVASSSEVFGSMQDGAGAGTLSKLAIAPDGTISAVSSNGTQASIAQVVLAQFANVDGLVSQGGSLYTESLSSGNAVFGAPGASGRGALLSSALEGSNVDMATELTKIINYQRAYQANARMITVTDQILQETMNLRQ